MGTVFHKAAQVASLAFAGNFRNFPEEPPLMPAESFVEVAGKRYHYLLWPGVGEPLFLLNGLNSNAWVWGRVGGGLSTLGPVVAVTLPGHGLSDPPDEGYSTLAMARALLPVILALNEEVGGGGKFSLCGHSFGGKIAASIAPMLGERLRTLVLADPVLPQGLNRLVKAVPAIPTAIFSLERGPFADREAMEKSLKNIIYLKEWGEIERRVVDHSFYQDETGAWKPYLPDEAFKEILFRSLMENSTDGIQGLQCPVLLARPNFTVSFLPFELMQLRRAWPAFEEARIAGDHDFIVTNPIDTVALLEGFIRKHSAHQETNAPEA